MEGWQGLIGVVVGMTLAWGLNLVTAVIANRRNGRRMLQRWALVCLDRVEKMKYAAEAYNEEQRQKELNHLGRDMDRYLDEIAASGSAGGPHWETYETLRPLLLRHDHDKAQVDAVVKKLARMSGRRLQGSQ